MCVDRLDAAWLHNTAIQVEIMASATRRLPQQSYIGVNALHIQRVGFVKACVQMRAARKCEAWTSGIKAC